MNLNATCTMAKKIPNATTHVIDREFLSAIEISADRIRRSSAATFTSNATAVTN
jgi:hypothetical protein